MKKLENIQVEEIAKNNFRIITTKGQYLQSNSRLIAFIDNDGYKYLERYYYTMSESTIKALCKFFRLTKKELLDEYRNEIIKTI